MSSFKTAESPFKANNTASNMAGFTLMNNQVGAVVAQLLAQKDNVKVTYLPSMIRVDGTGMFEVDYDDHVRQPGGRGRLPRLRPSRQVVEDKPRAAPEL